MPEVATVEDLKTVPIEAVKPTGEAVPVAEVVQAPPVEVAKLEEPATLPKTGSDLPLLACIGLLSLGAAVVTKKYSA
jgi:LPXTG-motif cell wall-anchored protein